MQPHPHTGAPQLLGELLIARCGVRPDDVDRALAKQREEGGLLGEILLRLKHVDEDQLALCLAEQAEMPALRDLPRAEDIPADLVDDLPINFAKQHRVMPLARLADGRVQVAITDPTDLDVLDDIAVLLGAGVEPVVCAPTRVLETINKAYARLRGGAELQHKEKEEGDDEFGESEELVDILDLTDEAPIIRWVNSLLFQAVKERASDIHIEPGEKDVMVRYRIDGVLREAKHAPKQFTSSILARVKIMAGLNIAEKRLPQDGRIRRKIAGKEVDMRVATAPTANGERVTIRLLDRSSVLLGLADIGMGADHLVSMRAIIERPHGILLVTGPTGSGKTTTLYACLSEINSPELNILTVEDPVEYQLEGISQTQINPKIDLTFSTGLRSFLRHDPDVIMVGEIRDRETAEIAIQASLTGHFVFSTVHTNDAAGGITRLVEMGIEPFLVASSLVGLLAQRLVRRPCPECARPVRPSEQAVRQLGLDPERFYAGAYQFPETKGARMLPPGTVLQAVGCPSCLDVGYRGRTGIYELLMLDDKVRRLTLDKADAGSIRSAAIENQMVTLRMDGARKVVLGMTTPEEVMMVTAEAG
ncbi:MAG: type II secretion system ATPase GspE [Kofleriaceae bacterium]|nr:type II secretion system ATPase GspE [Myxococcales bacterium]MCB9560955.1 type II secretion system ATPase GspE [Kofleriaceae bacterium]MCB9574995.1 type II secretion system ATPase GspE [Kofleriaceae bacterium]